MIKIFEAFAGYSSQMIALQNVFGKNNVKNVGIAEVDCDVIITNALFNHSEEFYRLKGKEYSKDSIEKMKELLKKRNIGFDFDKGKSKIDRMPSEKIISLAIASKLTNNYGDISLVNKIKMSEEIDIFTYSSPCQSFSVAGKQEGLDGESGLLLECESFIKINRPKVLMLENVKNLVGKKFIGDFNNWIKVLEDLGYNNYWEVLNAKDFGVPQNRERVFLVSIRNDIDFKYKFPNGFPLQTKLKDILEKDVDEKYYYQNERSKDLVRIILEKVEIKNQTPCDSTLCDPKPKDIANCITARYDSGIVNQKSTGTAVLEPMVFEERKDEGARLFKDNICGTIRTIQSGGDKRVLEPTINRIGGLFDDESRRRQAGGIYDKEGLSPTLDTGTGGWRQPCIIDEAPRFLIKEATKIGYKEAFEGDGINMQYPNSTTRRGRVQHGMAPTIMCNSDIGTIQNYRIRKLTPKECFRLMGVSDDKVDRAAEFVSNSALYKQAGNSIVVNVLEAIFKNMKEILEVD